MHLALTIVLILSYFTWDLNAGTTSSYVRPRRASKDMPLDYPVFAVPPGFNAPQQVHVTQGDYEGQAVIVSWITQEDPGTNEVFYGTSQHYYDNKAEGSLTNYTFYNYTSGFIHHCVLADLEYNTKYYYKIGNGSSGREFWFYTAPESSPDAAYTFGVIGDLGQTFHSLSTFEHYLNSSGQTVLYVGDLSYADDYKYDNGVRWDTFGRFLEPSTAYQAWIWTAGNHEIEFKEKLGEVNPFKPFTHRYRTPYKACQSTSPLWYAVKRASAHIIVLSSYSPYAKYTPQYIWLKKELKRVNRRKTPWLIVLMHSPLYNSNSYHYMEGETMRVVFEPWFVKYKVDIIFAGHVHAYERTNRYSNIAYNITNKECKPVEDLSAPIYVTIGDGGNMEGLAGIFTEPQPEYSAFREASYGHAILDIKNRTHAYYYWNRNQDGTAVASDYVWLLNQFWKSQSNVIQQSRLINENRERQRFHEQYANF